MPVPSHFFPTDPDTTRDDGEYPRRLAANGGGHRNQTAESDILSKDLKRRGFRFVGSTTCYAFMQAAGRVNDHTADCFRHADLTHPPTPHARDAPEP